MKLRATVARVAADAEEALDRLKLRYKARFDRFDPAQIEPYLGWGRPDLLVLRGRVMEATEVGFEPGGGLLSRIRDTVRRMETDEIRGATVRATFGDRVLETQADDEAFFQFRIEPPEPLEPGWHSVELEIVRSMAAEDTGPVTGHVLVPPPDADFAVLSDLDDTVLHTGATSRFRMLRTVLLNDAHSRTPFHGVAPFYHALQAGPSGNGGNPLFYLSRSAWNLYGMLRGFLAHHGLPRGPLLLKDYALHGVLAGHEEPYKARAITALLDFFPELPFVLIGDSGQDDPETYARIARERPERIRAILVRDVTPPERDREVRRLADEMAELGVPMVLAEESLDAAREAARLGLIHDDRLPGIRAAREQPSATSPSLVERLLGRA